MEISGELSEMSLILQLTKTKGLHDIAPPPTSVTTLGEQHCPCCLLSQASQDAFTDPRAEHLSLSPGCVCSGLWDLVG